MESKNSVREPRIVSCFLLFNEIDILRLRLKYEYDFIDQFVIIEGAKTFSGESKILYFQKYKYLFDNYLEKINYHVVNDLPTVIPFKYVGNDGKVANEYRWHLEEYTRNTVKRVLKKLDLNDSDIILMSDIDEILSKDILLSSASKAKFGELHHFYLSDYRGSIDKPPANTSWVGPYIIKYLYAKQVNLHTLRTYKNQRLLVNLKSDLRKLFSEKINTLKEIFGNFLKNESQKQKLPTKQEADKILRGQIISQIEQTGKTQLLGSSPVRTGIKKIVRHQDAGWHLSNMTGGLSYMWDVKANSFSHSECSSDSLIDSTCDHYDMLNKFITEKKNLGLYQFNSIDNKIPDFIKDNISDYCILLQPE